MRSPFTTTAAVAARIRELGIIPAELADRAGVSQSTVRYFGLLPHDQGTLERLSVALGWPPNHLRELSVRPGVQSLPLRRCRGMSRIV